MGHTTYRITKLILTGPMAGQTVTDTVDWYTQPVQVGQERRGVCYRYRVLAVEVR